jgi:hypothetical protein
VRLWAIVLAVATTIAAVAVNALLLGYGSGGDDRVGNLSPRASLNLRPAPAARRTTTPTTVTTTTSGTTITTPTTTSGTTTDDHGGRGRGRGRGEGRDD